MKKCPVCKEVKNNGSFHLSKSSKWWLHYHCKECSKEIRRKYLRSKPWLFSRIYWDQRSRYKKRWYWYPEYSKEEFIERIESQESFEYLFKERESSWYKKDLVPSIDRVNDYKWYTLSNIRLVTRKENNDKAYLDRKEWINTKNAKSVTSKSKSWVIQQTYYSIQEAERSTWIDASSIVRCCKWKVKTAWWYKWFYNSLQKK